MGKALLEHKLMLRITGKQMVTNYSYRGHKDKKLETNNSKPAKRKCLGCTKMFDSDGPHNRLCKACTDRNKTNGNSLGDVVIDVQKPARKGNME